MQPWQTLARKTIFKHSKFLTVEEHIVALPDGRVIADWPWVITPDYINVVVITDEAQFLCFRQTKYVIAGTSLAPVGGYLEPGEDPLVAAQRELLEETGYAARTWIDLGHYPVEGNRGCGTAHLYLATSAHPITARNADDLEEQEIVLLSHSEIEHALDAGEFKVLAWAANVALALRRLQQVSPEA